MFFCVVYKFSSPPCSSVFEVVLKTFHRTNLHIICLKEKEKRSILKELDEVLDEISISMSAGNP